MSGWVCVYRDLQDHWLWDFKHPDKAMAWIDMIMLANHDNKKLLINGVLVECARGELAYSQLTLGLRWHWSRNKVRNFLELLKTDGMIVQRTNNVTTVITICNYSQYQDIKKVEGTTEGTPESTGVGTATVQREVQPMDNGRDTNNNVNNYNNENNENKKEKEYVADAPFPEKQKEEKPKREPKPKAPNWKQAWELQLVDLGVEKLFIDSYFGKWTKQTHTQGTLDSLIQAIGSSGLTMNQAMKHMYDAGWKRFNGDWYANATKQHPPQPGARKLKELTHV